MGTRPAAPSASAPGYDSASGSHVENPTSALTFSFDDRRPQVATDGNGIWMVTWTGGDPMGPAAGDGDVYRTSNPCQDVLGNRSFVHTATAADIISSATTINDARLNGNNLARILVTPNLTPGGGGAVPGRGGGGGAAPLFSGTPPASGGGGGGGGPPSGWFPLGFEKDFSPVELLK